MSVDGTRPRRLRRRFLVYESGSLSGTSPARRSYNDGEVLSDYSRWYIFSAVIVTVLIIDQGATYSSVSMKVQELGLNQAIPSAGNEKRSTSKTLC